MWGASHCCLGWFLAQIVPPTGIRKVWVRKLMRRLGGLGPYVSIKGIKNAALVEVGYKVLLSGTRFQRDCRKCG